MYLVLYTTIYTTVYETRYAVVTRYWARLPDGTRVLKREVTRYLEPEEYAVLVEEERERRGRARAQVPIEEESERATRLVIAE
jgi:hypothetical protein